MRALELVIAIRHYDESRDSAEASREQAQHVERGLVRPVCVFHDENYGRSGGELPHELRCDFVGQRTGGKKRAQAVVLGIRGDIEERAEGAGREERLACAPENSRRRFVLSAEAPDECRLADPCLAVHERQCPARFRVDGCERRGQHAELAFALEQVPLCDRHGRRGYDHINKTAISSRSFRLSCPQGRR